MKIVFILALVVTSASVFAQENLGVPEKSEATLCPLARKAQEQKVKEEQKKNADDGSKKN